MGDVSVSNEVTATMQEATVRHSSVICQEFRFRAVVLLEIVNSYWTWPGRIDRRC